MSTPTTTETQTHITHARYGKDKIRVFRVVRAPGDAKYHDVVEYNVTTLLEGELDVSFTQADNSVIVATDSIKNITYYLAKVSPHILHPERFALHVGTHLVSKYAHIHKAFVKVEMLRWARIPVADADTGKEEGHGHAFWRDGEEKRFVSVEVDATAGKDKLVAKVSAGISDLLVLKSTSSSFTSFIRDEYTTLPEVEERIFSTSVDLSYVFAPIDIKTPSDAEKLELVVPEGEEALKGGVWDGDGVAQRARRATLEVFALDDSASVQATLHIMAVRILKENAGLDSVSYVLPNKHYHAVDMRYIGVDNLTPSKAEVFMPVAAPSGLISATISRKQE